MYHHQGRDHRHLIREFLSPSPTPLCHVNGRRCATRGKGPQVQVDGSAISTRTSTGTVPWYVRVGSPAAPAARVSTVVDMAAAWPAGTPCEFLYADGKWYRAISRGLVGEVLELAEVRARGVITPMPLDEVGTVLDEGVGHGSHVASHVAAKGTHLVWTDADERKLELEKNKPSLSPHRLEEPISEKKATQPMAPKQKQKKPASEKKATPRPVVAPKQPAPRKNKKLQLRLVELGDDALHSVLSFVGPLGLGGAALACKRLLALVKSLSAEAKGTFDRWALAAACAGLAHNSLDRCVRGGELFIALCERTGRLRRCSKSQVLRELPAKARSGHRGDDVVGSWGRAYHVHAAFTWSGGSYYLIPTVIGCIGGELLRGVIAVYAYMSDSCRSALGTAERFELLKCPDSFKRLVSSTSVLTRLRLAHRRLNFDPSIVPLSRLPEAETVSLIHPHARLEAPSLWISSTSRLCPLLLTSMADANLPSLAELQALTQKCFPRRNVVNFESMEEEVANVHFAQGPALWPVEAVLGLICRAADAQLAKFEQLPLDSKLVSCVQIKPRPLCWLDLQGLTRLRSHALWRSGDAAGLDQLWDALEVEGLPLATAQSLLLQIVRLKARHFAGA